MSSLPDVLLSHLPNCLRKVHRWQWTLSILAFMLPLNRVMTRCIPQWQWQFKIVPHA